MVKGSSYWCLMDQEHYLYTQLKWLLNSLGCAHVHKERGCKRGKLG